MNLVFRHFILTCSIRSNFARFGTKTFIGEQDVSPLLPGPDEALLDPLPSLLPVSCCPHWSPRRTPAEEVSFRQPASSTRSTDCYTPTPHGVSGPFCSREKRLTQVLAVDLPVLSRRRRTTSSASDAILVLPLA